MQSKSTRKKYFSSLMSRYKKVNPFYTNRKWRSKAARIKRRDKYLCQEALRYGQTLEADVAHHIYPLDEYPELGYVSWNLIALSDKYHNGMHDRKTNKITELGKQWQHRRRIEFSAFMADRKASDSTPPLFKS